MCDLMLISLIWEEGGGLVMTRGEPGGETAREEEEGKELLMVAKALEKAAASPERAAEA